MTTKLSTGLRNAMVGLSGFAGALNGGVILVYSGPQPVSADAKATGTLLGRISLDGADWNAGEPAGGLVLDAAAGGGVAKPSNAVWRFVAVAAGNIGWFRHVGNAPDNGEISMLLPRLDGSASTDAKFSTTQVIVGQPVTIDVYSFQIPAQ